MSEPLERQSLIELASPFVVDVVHDDAENDEDACDFVVAAVDVDGVIWPCFL